MNYMGTSVSKALVLLDAAATECTASLRLDTSPTKITTDIPLPFKLGETNQSKCKPWDYGMFTKRASTFAVPTWFAKPAEVGPLQCARFGWINIGPDHLECISCGKQIIDKVSDDLDYAGKKEASLTLLERLPGEHKGDCPWKNNPSPLSFLTFQVQPDKEMTLQVNVRKESLKRLYRDSSVPSPSLDLSSCDGELKGDLASLRKDLFLVMAIYGWESVAADGRGKGLGDEPWDFSGVVTCRLCNRHVALGDRLDVLNGHRYFCPYRAMNRVPGTATKTPGWKIVLNSFLAYASRTKSGNSSSKRKREDVEFVGHEAIDPVQALKKIRAVFRRQY